MSIGTCEICGDREWLWTAQWFHAVRAIVQNEWRSECKEVDTTTEVTLWRDMATMRTCTWCHDDPPDDWKRVSKGRIRPGQE